MKLYSRGNRVVQAEYGLGTVTSCDERYTVIDFDAHGIRRFITDMVTLGVTDVPAPVRPAKVKRRKNPAP